MKLISMTDFVLEQGGASVESDLFYFLCSNYAQFLKQPLTIGMFVPCDENGNVLEEPIYTIGGVEKYSEQYQQAKERVLFEGFDEYDITVTIFLTNFKETIEDLVGLSYLELNLTESAITQIGL